MNNFIHSVEEFLMKSWNGLYKMLCKIWDKEESNEGLVLDSSFGADE